MTVARRYVCDICGVSTADVIGWMELGCIECSELHICGECQAKPFTELLRRNMVSRLGEPA